MARDLKREFLDLTIGHDLTGLVFYDDVPAEEVNRVEEQPNQEIAAANEDQNLVNDPNLIADGMEEAQEEPNLVDHDEPQNQMGREREESPDRVQATLIGSVDDVGEQTNQEIAAANQDQNIQAPSTDDPNLIATATEETQETAAASGNDDDQERESGTPVGEPLQENTENEAASTQNLVDDPNDDQGTANQDSAAEEEVVNHGEREGVVSASQESGQAQENIAPAEDLERENAPTPTKSKSAKKRERMRRKKEKQQQDERRWNFLRYVLKTSLLITMVIFIFWFFSIY